MTTPRTKTRPIAEMAGKMEAGRKSAAAALDAPSAIVREQVAAGGAVNISERGKISCRDRPKRMLRNLAMGEELEEAADRQAKVTVVERLKGSVDG